MDFITCELGTDISKSLRIDCEIFGTDPTPASDFTLFCILLEER